MIRHVPQRAGMDCGVACVAMAAGVSYEAAAAAIGRWPRTKGVSSLRGAAALERLTGRRWVCLAPTNPAYPLSEYSRWSRRPALVLVGRRGWAAGAAHWVVVAGKAVHDPNYAAAARLATWRRRNWTLIAIIAPERTRPPRWR